MSVIINGKNPISQFIYINTQKRIVKEIGYNYLILLNEDMTKVFIIAYFIWICSKKSLF